MKVRSTHAIAMRRAAFVFLRCRPSEKGDRDDDQDHRPHRLPAAQVEPAKRRARRPTLASVAKQASKAGIEVARYEVEPDKIVVIVVGKSGMDNAATTNEWDQEFDGAASEIH